MNKPPFEQLDSRRVIAKLEAAFVYFAAKPSSAYNALTSVAQKFKSSHHVAILFPVKSTAPVSNTMAAIADGAKNISRSCANSFFFFSPDKNRTLKTAPTTIAVLK